MVEFDELGFALSSGEVTCHCCYPSGAYIGALPVYVSIDTGLPAHSYLDAPPKHSPGEWPSRQSRDTDWIILPDFRGQIAYNVKTKAPREISELGPINDDETLQVPSSTYDEWSGQNWLFNADAEATARHAEANSKRISLLDEANMHIAVLRDAVEFGIATEEEKARYNAWRRYRIELSRIDLSVNPIIWPEKPN